MPGETGVATSGGPQIPVSTIPWALAISVTRASLLGLNQLEGAGLA